MNYKHGHKRQSGASRLYQVHHNMMQRCYAITCPFYKNYGGRGIRVFKPWHEFKRFLADLPPIPSDGQKYFIDRIDNDGGYFPGNIKWSTRLQQSNNKTNNHMVDFNGKKQSLAMWAKEIGINYNTLKTRINQGGLSPQEALTKSFRTGSK